MKLIVGLGNPGPKYLNTRHNVGFIVLDELALKAGLTWNGFSHHSLIAKGVIAQQPVILLKPQTFMNESGASVAEVSAYYKVSPEDIWVVHDDLDLKPGLLRLSEDASAAGHRGVESIIASLGTQIFKRFRYGIGRPDDNRPAESFVLEPLPAEYIKNLIQVTTAILSALEQGFVPARDATTKTPAA